MQEIIKIVIGIAILLLGIPIGNFLASQTKEELTKGKKWFKTAIIASLIVALIGLILRNDVILFSFGFIAIVISRSLRK